MEPAPADKPDPAESAAAAQAEVERLRVDAVDLAESLREKGGDRYDRLYAEALFTLAERLREQGQHAAAAEVVGEAVAVRRLTPQIDAQQRIAVLAPVLSRYAQFLLRAERPAEAAEAASEAMDLFRDAADDGEFDDRRASTLRSLSFAYRDLDRHEEAFEAAHRALAIARRLVAHRPGKADVLFDCLLRLAWCHALLGRADESLAAAREALEVAGGITTPGTRSRGIQLAERDLAALTARAEA
jgi:tetratricopeptide (TPR) repeat protein